MKMVVAFLAFDRLRLIKTTLSAALRFVPQSVPLKVFQDGWLDEFSGRVVGNQTNIFAAVEFYKDHRLDVRFAGPANIGVAQMMYSAERWAFEESRADCLIVIEDDILVSPNFFRMMKHLAFMAMRNTDIGSFSAFGNSSMTFTDQFIRRNCFLPMHHRWGFGITRTTWASGRALYEEYVHIIRGANYRDRPHERIRTFLSSLRNSQNLRNITSQDAVHMAISYHLNKCSFMPPPCYAVNIGKKGLAIAHVWFDAGRERVRIGAEFFHCGRGANMSQPMDDSAA
jgi:hypothetical protein